MQKKEIRFLLYLEEPLKLRNTLKNRIYRGLVFPIRGGISKKSKESNNKLISNLFTLLENTYFLLLYQPILIIFTIHVIIKHKIDIIFDRSSSKGIGVFAGKILNIPSIVEILDLGYSKLSLKMAKKIFSYTTKIIDPSISKNKVEITSAGVDTNIFNPDCKGESIREKYNLQDKKVIIYVGEMSAWHGAEDLIDVATKLNDDVKFLMIGKNIKMLEEGGVEKQVEKLSKH
ncbi:MAG: hypothetical protein ACE5KT_05200 [Methanosarcinales archaeon]